MASANDDQRRRMHRSPAYPSMWLGEAVEHAREIYKHERRNACPVGVIAQHCGTDIKSSKGLRLISALKQFGLVVEEGSGDDRQVRLSERALDILLSESKNSPERTRAVRDAALSPPLHQKLWGMSDGHLPSDASLRSILLRKLEFNDAYVDKFIKQFRRTLDYAGLVAADKIEDDDTEGESSESSYSPGNVFGPSEERLMNPSLPAFATAPSAFRDLPITLPSLNVATLRVPFPMSEADFNTLSQALSTFKDALVKKPETPSAD